MRRVLEPPFEIPVAASEGLAGADRSVVVKRGGARGRPLGRHPRDLPPLLGPADAGNGAHLHLT